MLKWPFQIARRRADPVAYAKDFAGFEGRFCFGICSAAPSQLTLPDFPSDQLFIAMSSIYLELLNFT